MEEVWSVLGISGCVACCCKDDRMDDTTLVSPPRTFDTALKTIIKAKKLRRQRGKAEEASKLMSAQRLLAFHLLQANPFMHVPHADVECFPMDWLHGMYVRLGLLDVSPNPARCVPNIIYRPPHPSHPHPSHPSVVISVPTGTTFWPFPPGFATQSCPSPWVSVAWLC